MPLMVVEPLAGCVDTIQVVIPPFVALSSSAAPVLSSSRLIFIVLPSSRYKLLLISIVTVAIFEVNTPS